MVGNFKRKRKRKEAISSYLQCILQCKPFHTRMSKGQLDVIGLKVPRNIYLHSCALEYFTDGDPSFLAKTLCPLGSEHKLLREL